MMLGAHLLDPFYYLEVQAWIPTPSDPQRRV